MSVSENHSGPWGTGGGPAPLAELLEASGEHILFGVDCVRGVFTYASPRLAALHGTTPDILAARGLSLVLDERLDRVSARRIRRQVLALCRGRACAELRTELDFPVRQPDGDDLWFRCSLFVRSDVSGRPQRVCGLAVDVTPQLHGEVALREREGAYRATMDSLQVGVFVVQHGRFRYVNSCFQTMFGYSESECLRLGPLDMVIPERRAFVAEQVARRERGESVGPYEVDGLRADGTHFPLQVMGERSVFDGQPATVGTLIDKTRERRAEHAMKAAIRRYEALFEGAPDAILVVDATSGRVVASNLAAQLLFRMQPEHLCGVPLAALCPEVQARAWPRLSGVDGRLSVVAAFEVEICNADGESVPVEVRSSTVETAGDDLHLQIVLRDISRRKRDEQALKRDACVFETSQEAILLTDAEQRIVTVNSAFLTMTGYRSDEVLGQRPALLRSGRHEAPFYAAMWAEINSTGRWQGEVWDRRSNGEIFPVWLRISVHCDEDGKVCNYVGVSTDISERVASQESIRRLAFYDPLTCLPNRRLLQDRLEQLLAAAERAQSQVALLFIDLDHFKKVNDTLGHSVGDRLLVEVARRLQGCVRRMDTVARIGGDEFIVLLTDINRDGAVEVARKVIEALSKPCRLGSHELSVTPSLGISLYPQDGCDFETLLKHADTAMYRAKDKGRNAFEFFTSGMDATVLENFLLENELRQALQAGQFILHYQPKLCLGSGDIVGAEALIRWQHPLHGLVSPARFIPLAENCGLIEAIGDWVLFEACRQNQAWRTAGLPPVCVAVNISSVQFRSGRLEERIRHILESTGLPPGSLEIELTEGVVMSEAEGAIEALQRLSAMGIQIAIDDFGTGYSSLSYLKLFPIDRLKLDKSFVRDIAHDNGDRAIATAVIRLGHSLQLRVIAEGVERPEQLEALRQQGCDEIQGFHFSKPLPPGEFAALLWRQRRVREKQCTNP